jgi:hypothetical protein
MAPRQRLRHRHELGRPVLRGLLAHDPDVVRVRQRRRRRRHARLAVFVATTTGSCRPRAGPLMRVFAAVDCRQPGHAGSGMRGKHRSATTERAEPCSRLEHGVCRSIAFLGRLLHVGKAARTNEPERHTGLRQDAGSCQVFVVVQLVPHAGHVLGSAGRRLLQARLHPGKERVHVVAILAEYQLAEIARRSLVDERLVLMVGHGSGNKCPAKDEAGRKKTSCFGAANRLIINLNCCARTGSRTCTYSTMVLEYYNIKSITTSNTGTQVLG